MCPVRHNRWQGPLACLHQRRTPSEWRYIYTTQLTCSKSEQTFQNPSRMLNLGVSRVLLVWPDTLLLMWCLWSVCFHYGRSVSWSGLWVLICWRFTIRDIAQNYYMEVSTSAPKRELLGEVQWRWQQENWMISWKPQRRKGRTRGRWEGYPTWINRARMYVCWSDYKAGLVNHTRNHIAAQHSSSTSALKRTTFCLAKHLLATVYWPRHIKESRAECLCLWYEWHVWCICTLCSWRVLWTCVILSPSIMEAGK